MDKRIGYFPNVEKIKSRSIKIGGRVIGVEGLFLPRPDQQLELFVRSGVLLKDTSTPSTLKEFLSRPAQPETPAPAKPQPVIPIVVTKSSPVADTTLTITDSSLSMANKAIVEEMVVDQPTATFIPAHTVIQPEPPVMVQDTPLSTDLVVLKEALDAGPWQAVKRKAAELDIPYTNKKDTVEAILLKLQG